MKNNVHYHPTITINDFTYRGNINYKDIREALCAAYTKKVGVCNLQSILKDKLKPTVFKAQPKQKSSGVNIKLVLIGGLAVFLINIVIW